MNKLAAIAFAALALAGCCQYAAVLDSWVQEAERYLEIVERYCFVNEDQEYCDLLPAARAALEAAKLAREKCVDPEQFEIRDADKPSAREQIDDVKRRIDEIATARQEARAGLRAAVTEAASR